jgi:hypothetical protein
LGAGLLLAMVDLCVSLFLRGLVRIRPGRRRTTSAAAAAAALTVLAAIDPATAQTVVSDGTAPPPALIVQLAYVRTGDSSVDDITRAGLAGLSSVVSRRTAAELGAPAGVDPESDELAFYVLLYWPLDAPQKPLSTSARERLKAYLRSGGTILFDSRSRNAKVRGPTLRALAEELDLPPLFPVPEDHLLRRSYYLLAELPGRFNGDTVWVARSAEDINDGVTAVIAGSHDWVGAWAVDDAQRPMLPVVPGGDRQRELAYRFGVNLVIHVLTGSYKADQVHLPAIMERLGR